MFDRLIEDAFIKSVESSPVVIFTGARQTGKTTLCKKLLGKTHRYLSLEDPDVHRQALDDPRSFLESHPPPLILAGIQYAPDLPSYLRSIVDKDRYWHGQFILTGSQGFLFMEQVRQSLAGRAALLTLYPASIEEVDGREAAPRFASEAIADWILRGGYPELREKKEIDPWGWCANYIRLFLERDVRRLMNVENLDLFERFLRLVAAQTASVLNLSNLARKAGISQPTARRWLSLLEASHQIFLLPPYRANLSRRLVKAPKLYFIDTALASYLLGLRDPQGLLQGPFLAPLFETAVVSEHLKHFASRGDASRGDIPLMSFIRTHDGVEVDLLIEEGGRLHARNIQVSKTPHEEKLSGLTKVEQLLGKPLSKVLLAPVGEEQKLDGYADTAVRPWHWVQ